MGQNQIKRLGILCSGGDSPGMNCAIRSVVRTAIGNNIVPYGIYRGYAGLLENNIHKLDRSDVGNILQHGGTILQTSRSPEFHKKEYRAKAAEILRQHEIDALVVIGGNGSYMGAWELHQEHGFPVAGIPGTIDNDISGTDYTIGFDTAVQTAVEAVDKIRDTASSHERTFIVEVMGRKSSAIAYHVGVCTGAENIVLPKENVDYNAIAADIKRGIGRGKNSSIIIAAESDSPGFCHTIRDHLKNEHNLESRVCILGHVQRGGNPSAMDRLIASRMGNVAVEALIRGEQNLATCYLQGEVKTGLLESCLHKRDDYRPYLQDLAKALSI